MKSVAALILFAAGSWASVAIHHPSQIHGLNVDNSCGNPVSDVFRLVSNVVQPIIRHSIDAHTTRHIHPPQVHPPRVQMPTMHSALPFPATHVHLPHIHLPHRYLTPSLHHRIRYLPHLHHRHRLHHRFPGTKLHFPHRLNPRLRMNKLCNGLSCTGQNLATNVDFSQISGLLYPKLSLSKTSSLLADNGHSKKIFDTYYNKIY